ncbi:MAG: redox-sensing transcriptional repressor Rex [Planctomycetes bacterium]|nr:redox-sensing transcriptional repressor Rex [Planctomycetota bacterium]
MQDHLIPKASIQRLALYLRQLEQFQRSGETTVSSSALGEALGLTDAQVRKDLTYFGQFGHPGIGYDVGELIPSLRRILGIDRTWNVALVGVGNLGMALLHYRGFREQGFHVVSVFDQDPKKIHKEVNGLTILPIHALPEEVRKRDIRLGLICVPAESAQDVATALAEAGIGGILNFAPTRVAVPDAVSLCSVDLALELERLSFQVVRHAQPHVTPFSQDGNAATGF